MIFDVRMKATIYRRTPNAPRNSKLPGRREAFGLRVLEHRFHTNVVALEQAHTHRKIRPYLPLGSVCSAGWFERA